MPLEILVILVVGGISGIAVLLHLSGRSGTPQLTEAMVRDQWVRHFPESQVRALHLASNRKAALVQATDGTGVIWVFGADTVARYLDTCAVTDTDAGLQLDFHDFAAPRTTITLTEPERSLWRSEMEAA